MNVLDLFSGIGGFSLGLERAGMRTVAFCEIDPFYRRVLAKHWPDVPVYNDVRSLTADRLRADGIAPDVICGGFPCQDISVAGKGAGLAGERSGLWSEYARIIGEVGPRYVIVENVAALLGRGLDKVLRDLAALGLDAEWHCIPASAVGAPHRRDRIWIVANPVSNTLRDQPGRRNGEGWADTTIVGYDGTERIMADANRWDGQNCWGMHAGLYQSAEAGIEKRSSRSSGGWLSGQWDTEPDVGRVAHGVPARVDRLRSLGNAVVPQIPEIIGRAIMRAHQE